MPFISLPTFDELPELGDVIDASPLEFGPGVGVNEMVVAAGYHPYDFGLVATRAFGGSYPHPESDEWEEITTPFRTLRAARGLAARLKKAAQSSAK